jgi:hypothetical protein
MNNQDAMFAQSITLSAADALINPARAEEHNGLHRASHEFIKLHSPVCRRLIQSRFGGEHGTQKQLNAKLASEAPERSRHIHGVLLADNPGCGLSEYGAV